MFEVVEISRQQPAIKVIGVGGGGGNAVEHMVRQQVEGVDFICANTDVQALRGLNVPNPLQLGAGVTKGLGAGADPQVGREAALEDREQLRDRLAGADMVFVTAGMGGGTGTGAAPVVAELAREMGALTVAVVTKPFRMEGAKRVETANRGIEELTKHVDSLITIPNDKLMSVFGEEVSLVEAFSSVDDVLSDAVHGVADLIIRHGKINVDFADVRTVMSEKGMAMMGSGRGSGKTRVKDATEAAVRSPLLEDVDLSGAKGVLVNIAASVDISLGEFMSVGEMVSSFASETATVVLGTVLDDSLGEELRVTLVVTGLGEAALKTRPSQATDELRKSVAGDGVPNYEQYDQPTAVRNSKASDDVIDDKSQEVELEFLDIPTFLRRQAD